MPPATWQSSSYPEASDSARVTVSAGSDTSLTIPMKRKALGANEYKVEEDTEKFWHFYREGKTFEVDRITFRRMEK